MGARRDHAVPPYRVELLSSDHDRATFDCGEESLNRYLRERVGQDVRKDVAVAYVLVEPTAPGAILGYYTLSAGSIRFDDLPTTVRRKLPRYPAVPAVLLGRLAVDVRARGRGFGAVLLSDALRRALALHRQVGVWAVIVDALDDAAARFYERNGFARVPDQPYRLYLTMAEIETESAASDSGVSR